MPGVGLCCGEVAPVEGGDAGECGGQGESGEPGDGGPVEGGGGDWAEVGEDRGVKQPVVAGDAPMISMRNDHKITA